MKVALSRSTGAHDGDDFSSEPTSRPSQGTARTDVETDRTLDYGDLDDPRIGVDADMDPDDSMPTTTTIQPTCEFCGADPTSDCIRCTSPVCEGCATICEHCGRAPFCPNCADLDGRRCCSCITRAEPAVTPIPMTPNITPLGPGSHRRPGAPRPRDAEPTFSEPAPTSPATDDDPNFTSEIVDLTTRLEVDGLRRDVTTGAAQLMRELAENDQQLRGLIQNLAQQADHQDRVVAHVLQEQLSAVHAQTQQLQHEAKSDSMAAQAAIDQLRAETASAVQHLLTVINDKDRAIAELKAEAQRAVAAVTASKTATTTATHVTTEPSASSTAAPAAPSDTLAGRGRAACAAAPDGRDPCGICNREAATAQCDSCGLNVCRKHYAPESQLCSVCSERQLEKDRQRALRAARDAQRSDARRALDQARQQELAEMARLRQQLADAERRAAELEERAAARRAARSTSLGSPEVRDFANGTPVGERAPRPRQATPDADTRPTGTRPSATAPTARASGTPAGPSLPTYSRPTHPRSQRSARGDADSLDREYEGHYLEGSPLLPTYASPPVEEVPGPRAGQPTTSQLPRPSFLPRPTAASDTLAGPSLPTHSRSTHPRSQRSARGDADTLDRDYEGHYLEGSPLLPTYESPPVEEVPGPRARQPTTSQLPRPSFLPRPTEASGTSAGPEGRGAPRPTAMEYERVDSGSPAPRFHATSRHSTYREHVAPTSASDTLAGGGGPPGGDGPPGGGYDGDNYFFDAFDGGFRQPRDGGDDRDHGRRRRRPPTPPPPGGPPGGGSSDESGQDRRPPRHPRDTLPGARGGGGGPPGPPGPPFDDFDDDMVRRPQGYWNLGRADKIQIPPFPSVAEYADWRQTVFRNVATSSRYLDYTLAWVQQIAEPDQERRFLANPSPEMSYIDAQLAQALIMKCLDVTNGRTKADTNLRDLCGTIMQAERDATDSGRMMKGREILWIIHRHFATRPD